MRAALSGLPQKYQERAVKQTERKQEDQAVREKCAQKRTNKSGAGEIVSGEIAFGGRKEDGQY